MLVWVVVDDVPLVPHKSKRAIPGPLDALAMTEKRIATPQDARPIR